VEEWAGFMMAIEHRTFSPTPRKSLQKTICDSPDFYERQDPPNYFNSPAVSSILTFDRYFSRIAAALDMANLRSGVDGRHVIQLL
jgi:hypothetical protein